MFTHQGGGTTVLHRGLRQSDRAGHQRHLTGLGVRHLHSQATGLHLRVGKHLGQITLMTDRIRVTAPGTVTVDPNTGAETVAQNVVYDGKGKVQTAGGTASQQHNVTGSNAVGAFVLEWGLYLHLPVTATTPREGCEATVVESADPALVGRRFRLVNMQSEKTHATARRWNVQEIPMEGGS